MDRYYFVSYTFVLQKDKPPKEQIEKTGYFGFGRAFLKSDGPFNLKDAENKILNLLNNEWIETVCIINFKEISLKMFEINK